MNTSVAGSTDQTSEQSQGALRILGGLVISSTASASAEDPTDRRQELDLDAQGNDPVMSLCNVSIDMRGDQSVQRASSRERQEGRGLHGRVSSTLPRWRLLRKSLVSGRTLFVEHGKRSEARAQVFLEKQVVELQPRPAMVHIGPAPTAAFAAQSGVYAAGEAVIATPRLFRSTHCWSRCSSTICGMRHVTCC